MFQPLFLCNIWNQNFKKGRHNLGNTIIKKGRCPKIMVCGLKLHGNSIGFVYANFVLCGVVCVCICMVWRRKVTLISLTSTYDKLDCCTNGHVSMTVCMVKVVGL